MNISIDVLVQFLSCLICGTIGIVGGVIYKRRKYSKQKNKSNEYHK